jgi:hypothetical protein
MNWEVERAEAEMAEVPEVCLWCGEPGEPYCAECLVDDPYHVDLFKPTAQMIEGMAKAIDRFTKKGDIL